MIARVTGCSASGFSLDQRLGRRVALGDPRPLIEKPGDLGERLEIEFDDPGAERLESDDVAGEGGLRPPSSKNRRGRRAATPMRKPGGKAESAGAERRVKRRRSS